MHIDFYILDTEIKQKALLFACRMLEKIYAEKKQAYIHAGSLEEAKRLDTFLWTYRDDSFLPHQLYDPYAENPETPPAVQIGFNDLPTSFYHHQVLFNLSAEIPTFYQQFDRLIEIVFAEPSVQQAARIRFKHYREQGFEIQIHKLEE